MIAIFYLVLQILKIYSYIVIANVIISWLIAFNVLNTSNRFEIYQMWVDKYEKGVTHNLEHVFEYKLEDKSDIKLDKNEHNEYLWLTRVKAAEKVFSHTNRQAIFDFVK